MGPAWQCPRLSPACHSCWSLMYVSYPTPQISESAFGEPELEQMPPEVPTLRWLAFCGFTVLQTLTAPPTPPHRRREVAPGVRRKLTDGRTDGRWKQRALRPALVESSGLKQRTRSLSSWHRQGLKPSRYDLPGLLYLPETSHRPDSRTDLMTWTQRFPLQGQAEETSLSGAPRSAFPRFPHR